MSQVEKVAPAASVDDVLRDAFREIESQPMPESIKALVARLTADPADEPASEA